MDQIKESLFQPGQPVSPDRFKGREDIIDEIIKYFPSINSGNPQHFFITGKRGMGKTSLANFISDVANKNHSMVTAHIMNDGVHTIEDLLIQIIERILNSIKSEKWSEKIFKLFGNNTESNSHSDSKNNNNQNSASKKESDPAFGSDEYVAKWDESERNGDSWAYTHNQPTKSENGQSYHRMYNPDTGESYWQKGL